MIKCLKAGPCRSCRSGGRIDAPVKPEAERSEAGCVLRRKVDVQAPLACRTRQRFGKRGFTPRGRSAILVEGSFRRLKEGCGHSRRWTERYRETPLRRREGGRLDLRVRAVGAPTHRPPSRNHSCQFLPPASPRPRGKRATETTTSEGSSISFIKRILTDSPLQSSRCPNVFTYQAFTAVRPARRLTDCLHTSRQGDLFGPPASSHQRTPHAPLP